MVIPKYVKLRATRITKGKRMEDIAAEIGMNVKTYWAKETGKSDFTIEEGKMLASLFGMTLNELFS